MSLSRRSSSRSKGGLLVVFPRKGEADDAGRHPYTLKGVFPRPAPEGKKTDGTLEIHTNGIRFRPDGPASKIGTSPQSLLERRTKPVDLLFSNIKHLFFQPSERSLSS